MTFNKIALLASALLIATAFSGCSKKPRRPNPLDTVMGPGANAGSDGSYIDQGGSLNPTSFGDGDLLATRSQSSDDEYANARRGILDDVYFNFDSASISSNERSKLNTAAEYLENHPNAKLILEGHCDWRGTAEYNLALGDRRSKSVQSFLATLGVSDSRLQTLSKGDLNATEGNNADQMTKERKVELLIVD